MNLPKTRSQIHYTILRSQGSGTFGVEGTLSTATPRGKKVLVVANGAYGLRIIDMCKHQQIDYTLVECADNEHPSVDSIDQVHNFHSFLHSWLELHIHSNDV